MMTPLARLLHTLCFMDLGPLMHSLHLRNFTLTVDVLYRECMK